MQNEHLAAIGAAFRLPGTFQEFDLIHRGNINTTIKVTYHSSDRTPAIYIFQKVNTHVFHDPEGIMENIDLVTEHIRSRYPDETTLHFHHTADGQNYIYDTDGSFWRVMDYVDSISYDSSDAPEIVRATGEAFGRFQEHLSALDGSLLHETIPDFHNTRKRLHTLFEDAAKDAYGRRGDVEPELSYISSVTEEAAALSDLYNAGSFPVCVTHNDTKSNNVLFERGTTRPLLVVDLDTIMPGMSVYDFGDAVRYLCNTAAEDEPDTSKVSFDTGKFRLFCEGYLNAVKDILSPMERQSLVPAIFSITIELASRFLDDYLTGDAYFRVDYPLHNLDRTRCQLALARDIQNKQKELERIIAEVLA